jgi:N-methylhydantoinase A/oxoprolinase/acetone carboxylase beta subunit
VIERPARPQPVSPDIPRPSGHVLLAHPLEELQKNESEGFIALAEDAADAWGISLESLFSGLDVVLYSGTGMLNTLLLRTGRGLTMRSGSIPSLQQLLPIQTIRRAADAIVKDAWVSMQDQPERLLRFK